MRTSRWLIFFLFAPLMLAHAQSVPDSHMITERYQLYNEGPASIFTELGMQIDRNAKFPDSLTYEQKLTILKPYPESYVYHEESSWSKRIWRSIDISDPINSALSLAIPKQDSTIAYTEALTSALLNGTIYAYKTDNFVVPYTYREIKEMKLQSESVKALILKEDWWYDTENRSIKTSIIGLRLSLSSPTPEGKNEIWLYYPQVCMAMKFLYTIHNGSKIGYTKYFEQRLFRGIVIKRKEYFTPCHMCEYFFNEIPDTDIDALIEIKQLKDELQLYAIPLKGKVVINYENGGRKIEGEMAEGKMTGKWTYYHAGGNIAFTIKFRNGNAHGIYQSFYENGNKRETGEFKKGLRTGTFLSYYPDGTQLSLRNYKDGLHDGAQRSWHQNGQKYMEFNIDSAKVNGRLTRWYADGTLLESGSMLKGFRFGSWDYNIRIYPYCCKVMKGIPYLKARDVFITAEMLSDCMLQFRMEHIHTPYESLSAGIKISNKLVSEIK